MSKHCSQSDSPGNTCGFSWPEVQATYQQIEKECSVMINKADKLHMKPQAI
jgi:hypothetical protein